MKKIIEKYGKKEVYIGLVIVFMICIVGISGIMMYINNKKQVILDSIYITFIENPTVEYGSETVDYQSFILESVGEVSLPTEMIDTKEVGSKELVYKVSKEGYEKEQKVNVEVKDTKAPEITLKEETISIEVGAEFDPKSNVESVVDPVDGVIEEYEITHNLDNNTAGEYTITIKAVDKNGNESTKSHTVVVKEVEQFTSNPVSSYTGNYQSTTPSYSTGTPSYSGSNNSSNNNSNNSSSSNNGLGYYPNLIGNSGKIFSSRAEAIAWAESQIFDKNSPYYMTGYSFMDISIGNKGTHWTVNFEPWKN